MRKYLLLNRLTNGSLFKFYCFYLFIEILPFKYKMTTLLLSPIRLTNSDSLFVGIKQRFTYYVY